MARYLTVFGLVALFPRNLAADTVAAPATNSPAAGTVTNAITAPPAPPIPPEPSLYNFTVHTLDGKTFDLGQFKGHVSLVVNTASNCGFTSQYTGLEKLYQDYKDRGFAVLAFPSNDFGGQEPGTPRQIATFCSTKYEITFPLLEKVATRGDGESPVYQFLATGHSQPDWNFHKYLVNKNGKVIAEFPSQANPESKEIRDAIDTALKQ